MMNTPIGRDKYWNISKLFRILILLAGLTSVLAVLLAGRSPTGIVDLPSSFTSKSEPKTSIGLDTKDEAWGPSPFGSVDSGTGSKIFQIDSDASALSLAATPAGSKLLTVCGELPEPATGTSGADRLPQLGARPQVTARILRLTAELSNGDAMARAAAILIEEALSVERPVDRQVCGTSGTPCAFSGLIQPQDAGSFKLSAAMRLYHLTLTDSDPSLWVLAKNTCEADGPTQSLCPPMPWRRWAEIDVGNATPWLMLANEAMKANDLATVSLAISAAAKSSFLDGRTQGALRVLSQPEFAPSNGWPALASMHGLLEKVGKFPTFYYDAALTYCRPDESQPWSQSQQQQCESVAELLISAAESTSSQAAGRQIGQALGWLEDRLDAYPDYLDLIVGLTDGITAKWRMDPWSCETNHAVRDVLIERGIHGDRGWLEKQIRTSGRSAPEWAAHGRRLLAQSVGTVGRSAQPHE